MRKNGVTLAQLKKIGKYKMKKKVKKYGVGIRNLELIYGGEGVLKFVSKIFPL